jgi:hypothetical protein
VDSLSTGRNFCGRAVGFLLATPRSASKRKPQPSMSRSAWRREIAQAAGGSIRFGLLFELIQFPPRFAVGPHLFVPAIVGPIVQESVQLAPFTRRKLINGGLDLFDSAHSFLRVTSRTATSTRSPPRRWHASARESGKRTIRGGSGAKLLSAGRRKQQASGLCSPEKKNPYDLSEL